MPAWRRAPVLAAAVVVALVACGRSPLPPRLAGLLRTRTFSGVRAARMMREIHGRTVAPPDATVAEYGKPTRLRVWLTRYPDAVSAHRAFTAMLTALRSASSPFPPPREDPSRSGRWSTVRDGTHHVFWVSDRSLYWVEGAPEVAFVAADQLPPPSTGVLALLHPCPLRAALVEPA